MKGAKMGENEIKFEIDNENSEVIVTQIFDAPREKVWKAMTDPKYIPEWWGPRNMTTKIDKQDLKVGGTWRYIQYDKDGKEFAFRGVFQTVNKPQEISFTFKWEAMPGHVLTQTMVLEDMGKQTKAVTSIDFPSGDDMKGMLDTGMEVGTREGNESMKELLAKMK
jgi:uncharacterized protein YndB with AHSA1/START domain